MNSVRPTGSLEDAHTLVIRRYQARTIRRSAIQRPGGDRGARDFGPRINYRIRVPEVRVIGPDGAQLGILPTREALSIAQEQGLDLVEVAATAQPPVCRILDYGKHKFDEAKKQKDSRKKSHSVEVKGIRMRPGMAAHDFDVRLRATQKFLEDGHKVQATLIFRGREASHAEIGRALLDKLATGVSEIGQVERPPLLEGRRMSMLLAPK